MSLDPKALATIASVINHDECVIIDTKPQFECPRFKVQMVVYRKGLEEPRKTYNLELPGDLLVIIPRVGSKLLMVQEKRPPQEKTFWTFPIGSIVSGMPLADVAQGILTERSGTITTRFVYLGSFSPSRYIKNKAHVMAAENVSRVEALGENYKDKVQLLDEQQFGSLLIKREMNDGLVLASYAYYVTSDYYAEVHGAPTNSNQR